MEGGWGSCGGSGKEETTGEPVEFGRVGDPDTVRGTVRPEDTIGKGGQGGAVVTSSQGGARVMT